MSAPTAPPEIKPQRDLRGRDYEIIDCDVHNCVPSHGYLAKFMNERWRRYMETFGMRTTHSIAFYATRPRAYGSRSDATPPDGGPPGSDVDHMRRQLLDNFDIDYAILNPVNQIEFGGQPPVFGAALTRATNDWTAEEWLAADDRFYASLCVAAEDATLATEEIDRRGDDPRFVQILLNVRTGTPLGNRRFWPVYEAATARGMPIALHVGGIGSVTGTGWPSTYFEDHSGFQQAFQAQLISMIFEGVFEQFPTMRVVLQEGGFTWLPSLMWRMDAAFEQLREEVPFLTRKPSEYAADHFWFTTQPIEEPERPAQLLETLGHLGGSSRLLFSSDYPHWDFDAPDSALPRAIPAEDRDRIMGANARALYDLPPTARTRATAERSPS